MIVFFSMPKGSLLNKTWNKSRLKIPP